jgi:hypothetical protein
MTKNKVLPKHINNSAEQAFVSARSADYELAQKAAAGDMEAFEQIYWQHHRRILDICLGMCKNATKINCEKKNQLETGNYLKEFCLLN